MVGHIVSGGVTQPVIAVGAIEPERARSLLFVFIGSLPWGRVCPVSDT